MILKNRYEKLMDKIYIDDDVRKRIVEGALKKKKQKRIEYLVSRIAIIGVAASILFFALHYNNIKNIEKPVLNDGRPLQVESVEEISKNLEFEIKDIDVLKEKAYDTSYYIIGNSLAQISYELEDNKAVYRKAKGNEDISGDYSVYSQEVKEGNILIKGNENLYNLALWTDEGYSYSLSFENGIEKDEFISIINSIE